MCEYDVTYYGADPLGNVSSAAAFQNAINAAITAGGGTVVIPAPPTNGFYFLDKTILIQPIPNTNSACTIIMRGSGSGGNPYIRWRGGSDTSIFVCSGMYRCRFENIWIWNDLTPPNTPHDIVFWDIRPTYIQHSSTQVLWDHCFCQFGNPGAGNPGNNIGWRVGQSDPSAYYQDNSLFYWSHCSAEGASGLFGASPQYGDIGWQVGSWNSEPVAIMHSSSSSCYIRYLAGPINTQVTSNVGTGSSPIPVLSTLGFKSTGFLQLPNNEIASYTGITSTTFTGVTRGLTTLHPRALAKGA